DAVDKGQKAPAPAGQRGQHVLEPYAAGDDEKHYRKTARADQDEHHHGGDAHGRLIVLLDQSQQVGNPHRFKTNPDHREIGDGKGEFEDEVFSEENSDHGADAGGDHADDQQLAAGRAEVVV